MPRPLSRHGRAAPAAQPRGDATYSRRAALQNSQAVAYRRQFSRAFFPKPSVHSNRHVLTTSAATASPLKVMRPRQIKQLTHRPQPQSLMAYTKRSPLSITPPQHRHDGLSTNSQYRPKGIMPSGPSTSDSTLNLRYSGRYHLCHWTKKEFRQKHCLPS